MKFIDLPRSLKEKVSSLYILKGEDFFVTNSAIKHISNACGNEFSDFNKTTFNDENYSTDKFIECVSMLPIGTDKKFILLKDISKLNKNDEKQISTVLENIPSTTCVVIAYNDAWKFLKNGEIIDCGKMDFSILSKFITIELKKTQKEIAPDALRCLIELCSYDMTKLSTELKKLSCCSDDVTIEKKDVLSLVNADKEYQVFELTESLGTKNGEKALKILCNFSEKKEPLQNLLGLISNHFRRIAHISITGMKESELATLFGVKEYAIVKAKQQAKYFSKIQLKNILKLLENVDEMIKSGKMTADNAVFYLVFKILYC
ncbi:MAG: DNA polymerase III subunit delta [Clostridia bacterium]|nr:DNA polymerase III subunit delta [Clostridia bacterium]